VFFLDHRERLWVGWDMGEFGAETACVDLKSGMLHRVSACIPEGFCELPDGSVWVCGGYYGEADIVRCDGWQASEPVYARGSATWPPEDISQSPLCSPYPVETISQIEPLEGGKRYAVFAGTGVWTVGADLKHWKRMATFPEHADDRGPSWAPVSDVRGVAVVGGRLIAATGRDGLQEVRAGGIVSDAVKGQVDVGAFHLVGETGEGWWVWSKIAGPGTAPS
jgi:hypothetical protein